MTTIDDAWQSFADSCAKRGTDVTERDKVLFYSGVNGLVALTLTRIGTMDVLEFLEEVETEISDYLASQERPTDLS